MNKVQMAYLAGLIDGEGNIAIQTRAAGNHGTRQRSYINYLRVANTDIRMLEWIRETTGYGTISSDVRQRGNRRQCYQWICAARQAEEILRAVFPYLVIKKEQAALVFEFRATFIVRHCRGGVPTDLLMRRKRHFEQLQAMHKGQF